MEVLTTIGIEPDPEKRRRQRWGQNIARTRHLRDMNRKQLAEACGVSVEAVRQWEAGLVELSPARQRAVAQALDDQPHVLFPLDVA